MPTYDFRCSHCDEKFEWIAAMRETVAVCPECQGPADRQFSVNAQMYVPASFRMTRGWHLPPRNHPSWETTAKEGTYKNETRHETLREFVEGQAK